MGISVVQRNEVGGVLPSHFGAVLQDHPGSSDPNSLPGVKPGSLESSSVLITNSPIQFTEASRQREMNSDSREFICGWGAAFINITVTFPMNKVMFRQMLHGISTHKAIGQLKREGIKNLYRGILPPLCQKTVSTSIMFGMYGAYHRTLAQHYPEMSEGMKLTLAAMLAGCTEAILCPFERVQTVLQDKKFHGMYRNSAHVAKELLRYGPSEYYRGMTTILLRNGPSNVLFFGLRGQLKEIFPSLGNSWYSRLMGDFVSGAFLGAFISTLTYPINVLKTHQQCQVGGPFMSIRTTFWDIYDSRNRKFRKIFSGVHVNYSRALVSWGIINASYEVLHRLLYSDGKEILSRES